MKYLVTSLQLSILIIALAACGGQDRSAMAQKTVQEYWYDIDHGNMKSAYNLMTSENQKARPFQTYAQDLFSFVTNSAGVSAKAGKPDINGDQATVPITLSSPRTSQTLHAYQHLFWENGAWRVSDANGALSRKK